MVFMSLFLKQNITSPPVIFCHVLHQLVACSTGKVVLLLRTGSAEAGLSLLLGLQYQSQVLTESLLG